MRDNCIFCKLTHGVIPVEPILTGEHSILIPDKNPIAPHHMLVITKLHYGSIGDLLPEEYGTVLADMFMLIDHYVCWKQIANSGYRIITNTGSDAGQTV